VKDDGNARIGTDSHTGESTGNPVRHGIDLSIGRASLFMNKRNLVRVFPGTLFHEVVYKGHIRWKHTVTNLRRSRDRRAVIVGTTLQSRLYLPNTAASSYPRAVWFFAIRSKRCAELQRTDLAISHV
jgi:hypothetical protein